MSSTDKQLISCYVFGASGYAGLELIRIINTHPVFTLKAAFVSENSQDKDKLLSELYPQFYGELDTTLLAANDKNINDIIEAHSGNEKALVFFATPHEFSHDNAARLSSNNITVFDLSGAFRLKQGDLYPSYYNFEHQYPKQLASSPYVIPELHNEDISDAQIISLPGCYPTAAQLALIPLQQNDLLDNGFEPVINAISGVSGAGRKASLANSYCELSLRPYNLFKHRHQPEIEQGVGCPVIFNPHVADFDRGIIATITVKVKASVKIENITQCFQQYYDDEPLVRLKDVIPTIKSVAQTPYCDLYWQQQGQHLIIVSAIDNLLKGAASQAIQVANLHCGLNSSVGLILSKESC